MSCVSSSTSATRRADLGLGDLAALEPEGDVALDVEVGEERVGLEDRVDVAAVGRRVGDVLAGEVHGPSVGSSKPPIIRSVVVLPHPLGPSRAKNEPRGISRSRASTASVSPKRLVTPRRAMSGLAAVHCAPTL